VERRIEVPYENIRDLDEFIRVLAIDDFMKPSAPPAVGRREFAARVGDEQVTMVVEEAGAGEDIVVTLAGDDGGVQSLEAGLRFTLSLEETLLVVA